MTGDEADVQGQSKGEESLSQRLPISYSLLDPQPQRQRTAVALQGLEGDPNSQPAPSPPDYSRRAGLGFPIKLPLRVISLEGVGLLGDFLIFWTLKICGSEFRSA